MSKQQSDHQLSNEIEALGKQIRELLGRLVEAEPTATKPGRLNTSIASQARDLEEKQSKLIQKLLRRHARSN